VPITPLPAAPVVPPELVPPALLVLAPLAPVLELPPGLPPPLLLVLPPAGFVTLLVAPAPLSASSEGVLPLDASFQQPAAVNASVNSTPNAPLRLISRRLK
jgi:hypothetical protein